MSEIRQRQMEFYRDRHGNVPFHEWLLTLSIPIRARISERLARVQRGLLGDIEPVGEGVSELRLHFGAGYRIYLVIGEIAILVLTGSTKDKQERTIKLAHELWKEHKSRLV